MILCHKKTLSDLKTFKSSIYKLKIKNETETETKQKIILKKKLL